MSRLYQRFYFIFFIVFFLPTAYSSHAQTEPVPMEIKFPGPESASGKDERNHYYVELLERALARATKKYTFNESPRGISTTRHLRMVRDGTLDVTWTLSSIERDPYLLPIRIPLDKGLIGWRIFLINSDDQPLFSTIDTLDQLRTVPAGLVEDWKDTDILKANGIFVQKSPNYTSTFMMLKQKRFRFFPRSVMEIWPEVENQKQFDFVVENHLLIRYPVAFYFYVNKSRSNLAKDIESGLNAMIADGEFDSIFERYHRAFIEKANINQRKIFVLTNPFLPTETPIARTELWFDPTVKPKLFDGKKK